MNITEAVGAVLKAAPDSLCVSSLGTPTSALRAASGDGPHLYLGGAMGSALAVALGVADCLPERQVVVFIGDGDFLMGANSLWTLSGLAPANLLVVVLCDGRYGITGGQSLVDTTSVATIAASFPSLATGRADAVDALSRMAESINRPGLIEASITPSDFPGPSPFVDPATVRARFIASYSHAPTEPS